MPEHIEHSARTYLDVFDDDHDDVVLTSRLGLTPTTVRRSGEYLTYKGVETRRRATSNSWSYLLQEVSGESVDDNLRALIELLRDKEGALSELSSAEKRAHLVIEFEMSDDTSGLPGFDLDVELIALLDRTSTSLSFELRPRAREEVERDGS